jgi:hypothetical protein
VLLTIQQQLLNFIKGIPLQLVHPIIQQRTLSSKDNLALALTSLVIKVIMKQTMMKPSGQ